MTSAHDAIQSLVDRWSRFVSAIVELEDEEAARRASLAVAMLVAASAIGLLAAAVHVLAGSPRVFLFTGLLGVPLLPAIALLRWTRRPVVAIHFELAVLAAFSFVSPLFTSLEIPIMLGLIVLPVVATAAAGVRAGLFWTVLSVGLLAGVALIVPLDSAARALAWYATLCCGCVGIAGVWFEWRRAAAVREAESSRDRAVKETTTRVETEASLRESQALFGTLFRRTPSLLILATLPDGRILDVNERFTELSGWSTQEAIGSTLTELDAWSTFEDRDRLRALALRSELSESVEIRIRKKDRSIVHLLASAEILEVDGRPCILAQGIDVTERKQVEDSLAEYRRELELRVEERGEQLKASVARLQGQERLVAVGTLAAGIAHQINNPIGAISAITELAILEEEERIDSSGTPNGSLRMLKQIREQARRCGRIVKSVLQFAREEPTAKWVEDLNPIVQRASNLVRDYAASRGGSLTLELALDRLPVLMSPISLEQVVVNLVRNAAESNPRGAEVRVTTAADGDAAVVAVTDDGRGIPLASRGRVLDPFYTTRLDEGGTGLGLSVVHGVVSDHDGKLSITAIPEGGTRIEIRLPLRRTEWDHDCG